MYAVWTKEQKDHPSLYKHKVGKPAPVMVRGCISACGLDSLDILKGIINAEEYIQNTG